MVAGETCSPSLGLGITQVILGSASIVFCSVLMSLHASHHFFGVGLWAGALITVAGAVSICATKFPCKAMAITSIVFCGVAVVMSGEIVGWCSASLAYACSHNGYQQWPDWDDIEQVDDLTNHRIIKFNCMMVLIGCAALCISIVRIIYNCKDLGCCSKYRYAKQKARVAAYKVHANPSFPLAVKWRIEPVSTNHPHGLDQAVVRVVPASMQKQGADNPCFVITAERD